MLVSTTYVTILLPRYDREMENLANKVCLVTGGTRGIGRAIAKTLLEEGCSVAICGRRQDSVDQAVASLRAELLLGKVAGEVVGKVAGRAADVKSYEDVAALFRFVDDRFGGLDVLVN